MTLTSLAKQAEKLIIDNSPSLLTAIGVAGSLTTAYLTGRASFRAAEIIRFEEDLGGTAEDGWPLFRERVKRVYPLYIPAAGTAAITVASIIGANRIGTRRAAAMAAAYTLSERAFSEYKEKVIEKMGETKEQQVRDEVAQNRVNRDFEEKSKVVMITGNEQLCYDSFSGRFFNGTVEGIKHAQNRLNHKINQDGYASLSDFYDYIDLPPTAASEEVGWNGDELMEIYFSTMLAPSGKPTISIEYRVMPVRGYYQRG